MIFGSLYESCVGSRVLQCMKAVDDYAGSIAPVDSYTSKFTENDRFSFQIKALEEEEESVAAALR